MFEVVKETDIVKILGEGQDLGFYLIKEIKPDKNDHCGQWWAVTFQLINHPVEFTWLLDNNQVAQEEFTMNNQRLQLQLYAGAMLGPVKKTSSPSEIISLF